MTPILSESRFDELFLRYWDNQFSDSEATEFGKLLATDPLARDWFRANSLHAVTAAELPVAVPSTVPAKRGWSRRRVLQYIGGGLAAGVTAGLFGRKYLTDPVFPQVRITAARGGVTVTNAAGRSLAPDGPLPVDATVITHGTNSSAVLTFPNGSDVLLAGDSAITFADDHHQLKLIRGSAIADVQPAKIGERAISFLTAQALVHAIGSVLLTLTYTVQATEVGVHTGQVTMADSSGGMIDSVRDGELFTLRSDGRWTKQALNVTPDDYSLDLSKPLPDGWFVGRKFDELSSPVIRPELWFDPYHQAEMYQIRSHNRWAKGLFRLQADSKVTVRYRVRE